MSSKSGAPTTAAAATPLSNDEIAFYTDVLILFVLLFFTLTSLPRIIARLTHGSAWRDGWIILRGASSSTPPAPFSQTNESAYTLSRKPTLSRNPTLSRKATLNEKTLGLGGMGSTESETYESSFGPYDGTPKPLSHVNVLPHLRNARGEAGREPLRVRSYHAMLHPISRPLSARYAGYSMGQYVVLLVYAVLMGVAMFLYASPVNNIKRAGYVCISQIPVVFALGTKNSLVGWLVGMGYEKVSLTKALRGRRGLIVVCS